MKPTGLVLETCEGQQSNLDGGGREWDRMDDDLELLVSLNMRASPMPEL